jgi:ribonuclease HII
MPAPLLQLRRAPYPQLCITIRRSLISLAAAATTARFPRPSSLAAAAAAALIVSPSPAVSFCSSPSHPSRLGSHHYYHCRSAVMGGRLTRSSGCAGAVPIASVSSQRRTSPRLRPSAARLSTSSASSDDDIVKARAPSSSAKARSTATARKTRGRPRRKAAEISSTDAETASANGRKKRRSSSRVKKMEETATTITTTKKKVGKKGKEEGEPAPACLPRSREQSLQKSLGNGNLMVIGVDEAGRGPLAGPVCAAAAFLPVDIPGITDSKKITKEEDRERLYEEIVAAPGVRWAAAVVDAQRIDEINILQATMEAMKMAANCVINPPKPKECIKEASVDRKGCYVICGANDNSGEAIEAADAAAAATASGQHANDSAYHALIDGNRVPKDMPCEAEPMVKGDSREYCIGAASLIAKVTRDRLMHAYDELYPEYNLRQHKGYPTAAHMSAVYKNGASPIHRRTFAPLKHMSFDKDGRIVDEEEE